MGCDDVLTGGRAHCLMLKLFNEIPKTLRQELTITIMKTVQPYSPGTGLRPD